MSLRTEQIKVTWRVDEQMLEQIDAKMRDRPRKQRSYQALLDEVMTAWVYDSQVPAPLTPTAPVFASEKERRLWADVQRLDADPQLKPLLRGLLALLHDTPGETATTAKAVEPTDSGRTQTKGMKSK